MLHEAAALRHLGRQDQELTIEAHLPDLVAADPSRIQGPLDVVDDSVGTLVHFVGTEVSDVTGVRGAHLLRAPLAGSDLAAARPHDLSGHVPVLVVAQTSDRVAIGLAARAVGVLSDIGKKSPVANKLLHRVSGSEVSQAP